MAVYKFKKYKNYIVSMFSNLIEYLNNNDVLEQYSLAETNNTTTKESSVKNTKYRHNPERNVGVLYQKINFTGSESQYLITYILQEKNGKRSYLASCNDVVYRYITGVAMYNKYIFPWLNGFDAPLISYLKKSNIEFELDEDGKLVWFLYN